MKHCTRCEITQTLDSFKQMKDGQIRFLCFPCDTEYRKEIRESRSQGEKHAERLRTRGQRYGMTGEEVQIFEMVRGYRCEMCGDSPAELKGKLKTMCIDHCHETGEVRGLLCPPCNKMLGNAQDEIARLQSGIDYLERTDKRLAEANG